MWVKETISMIFFRNDTIFRFFLYCIDWDTINLFLNFRPGYNLLIYPWLHIRNFTMCQIPPMVRDAEKHIKQMKEFQTREDDILFCTCPKSGNKEIKYKCLFLYWSHANKMKNKTCHAIGTVLNLWRVSTSVQEKMD
jgi:hypothetical protein